MCVAFLAETAGHLHQTKQAHRAESTEDEVPASAVLQTRRSRRQCKKLWRRRSATWQRFRCHRPLTSCLQRRAIKSGKNSPEKVISPRGVWTKKDDEKRDEHEKEELVLKCRVVGRGFQEEFDENLRRDSPTCSTLLVQSHLQFGLITFHEVDSG